MRPSLAPQIKDIRKEVVEMANTRQTGGKAASNAGKTLARSPRQQARCRRHLHIRRSDQGCPGPATRAAGTHAWPADDRVVRVPTCEL